MKPSEKIAHAAFITAATSLLRDALTNRLNARVVVDTGAGDAFAELVDEGGTVLNTTRLACVQLPLALPAAKSAAPAPPPCPHLWEFAAEELGNTRWYACVWCDEVITERNPRFAEIDARHRRNVLFEHPPVEAPVTSAPTAQETEPAGTDRAPYELEAGDILTLDGRPVEVMSVDAEAFVWRTATDDPYEREEGEAAWADVERIDGYGRVVLKAAPVEAPDAAPLTVELRVPAPLWRAHLAGLRDADDGELHGQWYREGEDRVVRLSRGATVVGQVHAYCVAHGVTLVMDGRVVSAPPATPDPAPKKKRTKKAAPAEAKADAGAVETISTVALIPRAPSAEAPVYYPVARVTDDTVFLNGFDGHEIAVPRDSLSWKPSAECFFAPDPTDAPPAAVIVTTTDAGRLVDARDFSVVPEHFRDLAPLAEPAWWCVVAQDATRDDETCVSRCTDLDTARTVHDRALADDEGASRLDRVVVFDPDGRVYEPLTWTRHAPTSAALAAHPEAKLFRVATRTPDLTGEPQEWAANKGLCWYGATYQRISPAEVRESDFWLYWHRENSDAVTIVPRELMVFVERRAAEVHDDGTHRAELRVEPWTATEEHHALRSHGSKVEDQVGNVWSTELVRFDKVVLYDEANDETTAEVDVADVHPTLGTGRWWTAITKKDRKKAPKPAKAPKAPKLARQTKVPDADALAERGSHRLIGLVGDAWSTLRIRSDETAIAWSLMAFEASKKCVRVRVYDGSARCTWDSLDGGEP